MTLHVIASVQDRLRSLPLVPTWSDLTSLPEGGIIEQIWGSPRCVSIVRECEVILR